MSASHLVVFPSPAEPGSPAERVRRLQAEVRALAREHIDLLVSTLGEAGRIAGEIADGGEAYPVGVRELSRRLTEDVAKQSAALTAIIGRG